MILKRAKVEKVETLLNKQTFNLNFLMRRKKNNETCHIRYKDQKLTAFSYIIDLLRNTYISSLKSSKKSINKKNSNTRL